jgi:hypothetical protein
MTPSRESSTAVYGGNELLKPPGFCRIILNLSARFSIVSLSRQDRFMKCSGLRLASG